MSEPRFIRIPPEESLLQFIREGLREAGISQRRLADILETDQPSISKKLAGKRRFDMEELSLITSLIIERLSSFPSESISKLYINSGQVEYVYSDEPVSEAAEKMRDGDFTQVPVFDREREHWSGLVTDYTLLRRTLQPTTKSRENWLKELKDMKIKDAEVIGSVPIYPITTSISEIAQALTFHYAVLIDEEKQENFVDDQRRVKASNLGIVTRADFLKLLTKSKVDKIA